MKNVLAVVGVLALVGLAAKKAIDAIVANIKVTPGTPVMDSTPFLNNSIRTDVPIVIQNDNPFPLSIINFFGTVSYGQLTLARVTLPTGFYVPANSIRTIVLNMDIPIDQVVSDTALLIQQGDIWNALLNRIELSGSVRVGGGGYSFVIPIDRVAIPIV